MIILSVACHIFIFGGGMSHRQNEREPIMDFTNNQNISGSSSAVSFAEKLKRVCQPKIIEFIEFIDIFIVD